MRVLAPAKINLHLRVGAVRDDGFHPLMTWMTTVALFDILTIDESQPPAKPAPRAGDGTPSLTCDDPSLNCNEANLVLRAAKALNGSTPVRMHLQKRIPTGGGLGGGSSDAARTLLALNQLWHLSLQRKELATVAQQLGSDVPFFLFGPSSLCQGRGEIVTPVAPPMPKWALLILPKEMSISTALVYQKFDALGLGKAQAHLDPPVELLSAASASGGQHVADDLTGQEWTALNSAELLPRLANDLEVPAFAIAPQLGRLRSELEQSLGRIVRMSGSGSTLFTLFDDEREARTAETMMRIENVRAVAVQIAPRVEDDLEN